MNHGLMSKRNMLFALLLVAAAFLLSPGTTPPSAQQLNVFQTMAQDVREESTYYAVRPQGEVKGGVILYPDDREDPVSYAPLVQRLAYHGLEVRVIKYPMGQAALFRVDPNRLLDEGRQLSWIALGLGSGTAKACSIADKSEYVAGLILVGGCSGAFNLNDNDLQITLYQFQGLEMTNELMAKVQGRLPADTRYAVVGSREDIYGDLNVPNSQKTADFIASLHQILEADNTNRKNRD